MGGTSAIAKPRVGTKSRKKYRKLQKIASSTPMTSRKTELTTALIPAVLVNGEHHVLLCVGSVACQGFGEIALLDTGIQVARCHG